MDRSLTITVTATENGEYRVTLTLPDGDKLHSTSYDGPSALHIMAEMWSLYQKSGRSGVENLFTVLARAVKEG